MSAKRKSFLTPQHTVVTGPIFSGKSTVILGLLDRIDGEKFWCDVRFPQFSPRYLRQKIRDKKATLFVESEDVETATDLAKKCGVKFTRFIACQLGGSQ